MTKSIFSPELRRLTAAAVLLAAPFSLSGCGTRASSGPRAAAKPAQVAPTPAPPDANIYVDEAMLSKPYAIIGGTVENTSGGKLENLSVEIELRRRDGGATERREVAVQPASLDPGKRGKYSLKVLSDDWGSSRVVTLRGGQREVAFKSLPGAKRPPERPGGNVVFVNTPPKKKSKGDEFINTPDTPISVP
ncbi:MAG TPA: hypothetical protein VFA21_20160 [Pyrinomonadaceae bacterium]|jgi:hypothetical protein|nr:hypothetical protein [Pyrinomonadaceae bacterium]